MININIGILGHVDSGKTSLVKALSTKLSTASLDKSPQSQERGITQDLGFSAFIHNNIQYTLVDCPGHASLMKTIIGGAQIIDQMILVIDVNKGIQPQTAECIVIGEILAKDGLIVVLNKIDLLKKDLSSIIKKLRKIFAQTKFGKNIPMIPISANPGGSTINLSTSSSTLELNQLPSPQGIDKLIDYIINNVKIPPRIYNDKPFLFSLDHCFKINGQGTIITGTIISGKIHVGDLIEFPSLSIKKKLNLYKSFKKM